MAQIIKLDQLKEKEKEIVALMAQNKIFVYPTDTVYGIGCNALDRKAVQKIRSIKGTEHPFSVIVPSKKWAQKYLHIRFPKYLKLLPGPYTLIFLKKRPDWLPWLSDRKMAIRIPAHPISRLVARAGLPFVTTSANLSGQPTITEPSQLPKQIAEQIDILIDGGRLTGRASTIFDLTGQRPRRLR